MRYWDSSSVINLLNDSCYHFLRAFYAPACMSDCLCFVEWLSVLLSVLLSVCRHLFCWMTVCPSVCLSVRPSKCVNKLPSTCLLFLPSIWQHNVCTRCLSVDVLLPYSSPTFQPFYQTPHPADCHSLKFLPKYDSHLATTSFHKGCIIQNINAALHHRHEAVRPSDSAQVLYINDDKELHDNF